MLNARQNAMESETEPADRVLVVEDDASARQAMTMLLEFEGFEVRSAPGGDIALEVVENWTPDLVISDVQMPGGDGFTLVSALRNAKGCRDTPILLVSARDEVERRINGLNLGADDFMSKPVDPEELLARIRAHLRRSHRRKALQHSCTIDEGTNLLNRRGLDEAFAIEVERANRGSCFSVLLIDLDDFKKINDEYGHAFGDRVLRLVAQGIESTRRSIDRAGRWGGDEFLVILSDCNAFAAPETIARFRQAIEQRLPTDSGSTCQVRCSIGAATYESRWSTEELIAVADRAMYEDKRKRCNAF